MVWLQRNKGMLVGGESWLSGLNIGAPAFPCRTASIALVTKLFQQLCYCWSQASVPHTEDLFREASVGEFRIWGSLCSSGPTLDELARAFPGLQLQTAMGPHWAATQLSK